MFACVAAGFNAEAQRSAEVAEDFAPGVETCLQLTDMKCFRKKSSRRAKIFQISFADEHG